jgi:signal transduction histidine kinase
MRTKLLQAGAGLAIVPMVSITLWLGTHSEHLQRPVAAAVYWSYVVAASMAIGIFWWRRRPASRFGPLLVLFGITAWVNSWQGANSPLPFDIGVLAEGPAFALTIYLFLAFPAGRIEPPVARWLMFAIVVVVLALFVPWALFSPVIAGAGALTGCAPDCPPNALQIASAPRLVEVAGKAEIYAALVLVVCVVMVYGRRLVTASRPQRRALLAVAVTSLLFLPAYFALNFAAWVLFLDPETLVRLQWAIVVTRVLLPLGFLVALLQARGFAARAQQDLLDRLAERPSPERWRDAVSSALDDPDLQLGYQDVASGRLGVGVGVLLEETSSGPGRAWVPIDHEDQRVAALVIDEALTHDPELLRAAASATLVAVENGALEGELRASRSQILEAGRSERERIGRDLHDSAQQRLIALRIRLMLLGEHLEASDQQEAVARLGDEVDQTLIELREVVEGIIPSVLADEGVTAALEAVARRCPVRVTVIDGGIGRPPKAVETAIYFCCVESLQNAAKHAGPDADVAIRLERSGHRVRFSIEDDGGGFDPAAVRRGNGLVNLQQRVAALGGQLEIDTRAGRGTRVSGAMPV